MSMTTDGKIGLNGDVYINALSTPTKAGNLGVAGGIMRDFNEWDHPISLERDHRERVFRSVSDES
jgi:hypothetical protein